MKTIQSALFFCCCLFVGNQGFAQDIAAYLHGGGSHQWELHTIYLEDNSSLNSEEFGDDEEYVENNDEATIVPETIIFHADGTCDLYYVAYYDETDGDADEDLIDEGYWIKGYWRVVDGHVQILEPEESDGYDDGLDDGGLDPEPGYTWWLTNVRPQPDDGEFECGFEFYGFTSGIQTLGYFLDE